MKKFPFVKQLDAMDCGPACLKMISKFYGKNFSLHHLRKSCFIGKDGVSLLGISEAAEQLGFRTLGIRTDFEKLKEATLPCIVHWKQNHFIVVYSFKNKIQVADPATGLITYKKEEFIQNWSCSRKSDKEIGIALLLEPSCTFFEKEEDIPDKSSFRFLFKYLKPYKSLLVQIFIGLLFGTLLSLFIPFLTQSLVDLGINNRKLSFVTLILIAQLLLYSGQISIDFIRSWILLHISSRINISIISDFLRKLMKLPIGFFDSKMIGDLMQRIEDHKRIEVFLTSSSLGTIFSVFTLFAFSFVLAFYSPKLLIIFLISSMFYVAWIWLFLKQRRNLDYKRFSQASAEQSNLYQLITGMQEIKLNNCEQQKRWEWENIQIKLFHISIKGLGLSQCQQSGAFFINEFKNILITFFSARTVIEGKMSLGMMMAVQSIIGMMNDPLHQIINFIQAAQDAKISLERLGEIHNKDDEEDVLSDKVTDVPDKADIVLENVCFKYNELYNNVLDQINLVIPQGKTTAIVGMSGSGKTTLIKLLLGFYKPSEGKILVGDIPLSDISQKKWRNACGVVMQDGFIFSDSIAKNIAVGQETIDKKRLIYAAKSANILDMISSFPLGFNTKIGQEGNGISQGQKQRILIARAIYKNPNFLFFDEATNALDANNERIIMENLECFFSGKTVLISAHRLSTVKKANQIIVIDKGKIVERGTHEFLTSKKGFYFKLVKNQLELGN